MKSESMPDGQRRLSNDEFASTFGGEAFLEACTDARRSLTRWWIWKTPEDISEAVQDAATDLALKLSRGQIRPSEFKQPLAFQEFARRWMVFHAGNRFRQEWRRHRSLQANVEVFDRENTQFTKTIEEKDEAWWALSQLPEREREVILLHLWDGKPYKEIAKALNTTPNRVSKIYTRAIRKLRDKLVK